MAKHKKKHHKKAHRKGRRHSLKGLFGMNLKSAGMAHDVVPVLLVGLASAGVAIGIRSALADSAPGSKGADAVKFAPYIGAGTGLLVSGILYPFAGAGAAVAGAITSIISGAALVINDRLIVGHSSIALALAEQHSDASTSPTGVSGLGAVVAEERGMSGLGAIVMQQDRPALRGLNGNVPHAGETINLAGTVNPGAFGR